ncbi:MAG TPA: cache and HAMP domain-containing protein [Arenibaculum sp.]|nr:cache and HAMP domain-containing protein [Arenibaculum sp.]
MRAPRSLETILTVGITALSTLSTLAVGILAVGQTGTAMQAGAGNDLLGAAAEVADRLDRDMFERWRDIRLVVDLQAVQGSDALRGTLETLKASIPEYAWIGLAGTDGRVIASTDGLLEGVDVSSRPWYRAGSQAAFAGNVHEAELLAQKLPGTSGEPERFVDVAMPVARPDGVPIGVLGAHLSWSWAAGIELSVLGEPRRGGAQALILDKAGTVIMGPKEIEGRTLELAALRAGRQGAARHFIETWPDGGRYLTAVAPTRGYDDYPGLGWVVLVRQDAGTAFAPLRRMQTVTGLTALAMALLAAIGGRMLAAWVARPLRGLVAAAAAISKGDAAAPVPHTRNFAEANRLGTALVGIAAQLRRRKGGGAS